MTAAPTRKYNPGFLTDDELVASFCVRTHEFESLIESLSACTGDSNQHQIVIGPRGSGKTSLLLRVAAEVRRDADLAARFFPIVFAEESYEVSTAGEFWLECLARLAIQAPEREDAPNLHTTLADLRTIHDDRTLGERCLAALLDFADREGKRLVLMVENLNMMFRDMMDRDAGWRLRKILQNEPRIILLASATSRFDEIDHPDHALYDQFRVLTLRPLNTAECAALWETVAGQSRPTNTIRSLEILTGGSPRLLAIVGSFRHRPLLPRTHGQPVRSGGRPHGVLQEPPRGRFRPKNAASIWRLRTSGSPHSPRKWPNGHDSRPASAAPSSHAS